MVIIFVRINVRPANRQELSQTFLSIVEHVRKESGCLHADFYQDFESENDFLVVEEWANHKDLDDHLQSDIFTVIVGAGSLMSRPPEILRHTVFHSSELEA